MANFTEGLQSLSQERGRSRRVREGVQRPDESAYGAEPVSYTHLDVYKRQGEILCKAAPELDPDLVKASQEYLADKYQADAPQWGYIDQERWDAYYAWLNEKGLTETPIEAGTGCSNEYLP